jgi:Cu+-exporting ATPase
MAKDPICGKDVDTLRARAVGIFGGVTYYFCSAECKERYVDPRQSVRVESTADSRPSAERNQPEPTEKAKREKKPAKAANAERADITASELLAATEEEPVRYARSRMRRITGDIGTPVVQIDLSPNRPAASAEVAAVAEPEPELEPARGGRSWVLVAVLMLILAGGVVFFALTHR